MAKVLLINPSYWRTYGSAKAGVTSPVFPTLGLATIAASASLKPTDTPTYTGTVSMQPSGRCPLRGVNGNFTRAKLTIPAGAAWTFANGVDLKAKPAGAR